MMLFKLSVKNVTKSMKDYAIYFFTLILGTSIFYVFNAIESQTVLLDVTSSTMNIIKLMTNILSGVSVFVSFILGFLIIYASRFLIKRRNKEFGIYMTLGMGKRKISIILFMETLIIGVISMFAGIVIGIVLSQLMSVFVSNMFEADMTKFEFIFSGSACIKTLIYFGIMYLLVMIFNTYNISRCKLIDLLYANKKSETVRLKNPVICTALFIISSCMLGYAYYIVTDDSIGAKELDYIFKPIILGVVSTFLIFWSLSGLLLRMFQGSKKYYYKGLNSFTLRQIGSKINTTVISMTVICLALFVTICVLSASLCIKNSMTENLETSAPADLELEFRINLSDEDNSNTKGQKYTVKEILNELDFDIDSYMEEYIEINTYCSENLTLGDTLGSKFEEIKNKYTYLGYDDEEKIIKLSDYNRLAGIYGKEKFTLNENEYIIIADFDSMVEIRNRVLKDKQAINVFGHNLIPKYTECKDGFIEMSANYLNTGIIVVPDDVIDENCIYANYLIGNYKAKDKDARIKTEEEIINTLESNNKINNYKGFEGTTKLMIAQASIGLGALVTFIGLYLGIVFLISSAAILALKELSESSDNKERFNMLRRIGADEKMINKALFNQIAIFFLFPLLLAIIHSFFGIKFCNIVLEFFGNKGLFFSIIMTAVFLVIIYGGYFLLTYFCSRNIIKER